MFQQLLYCTVQSLSKQLLINLASWEGEKTLESRFEPVATEGVAEMLSIAVMFLLLLLYLLLTVVVAVVVVEVVVVIVVVVHQCKPCQLFFFLSKMKISCR